MITILSILFLLHSCKNQVPVKPVWLNESPVILLPDATLNFKVKDKNCRGKLLSFIQPMELNIKNNDSGFIASLKYPSGIIEGPAQICIISKGTCFYYPVQLANAKKPTLIFKDYRSPKTVNPDSSLLQQCIKYHLDSFRNLVALDGNLFSEKNIQLEPKTQITEAIQNNAISSFYVQPGTCVDIPIVANYNEIEKKFLVTVGPLKDRYNNLVADGTNVEFEYFNGKENFKSSIGSRSGKAFLHIPTSFGEHFQIRARINNIFSTTIQINK